MYTAKLCSSIDKYIDTKSALEIKNDAPIVVNRMIMGYSAILGTALYPLTSLVDDAHGNKITAPVVYRKISMNCVTVVTWNRPLYNPKPEPIA